MNDLNISETLKKFQKEQLKQKEYRPQKIDLFYLFINNLLDSFRRFYKKVWH